MVLDVLNLNFFFVTRFVKTFLKIMEKHWYVSIRLIQTKQMLFFCVHWMYVPLSLSLSLFVFCVQWWNFIDPHSFDSYSFFLLLFICCLKQKDSEYNLTIYANSGDESTYIESRLIATDIDGIAAEELIPFVIDNDPIYVFEVIFFLVHSPCSA